MRRRLHWGVAAAVWAMAQAFPALAQTPPDTGATLIRAGRLFDSETGQFLNSRDILVRGRVIDSVGVGIAAPPNARVIDLSGYTVMPGLIDTHTHLLYLEEPGPGLTMEGVKAVVVEGTPLRALHGAARARTFLQAGITTVADLGNSGRFGDVALRRAIEDGSVDGPTLFVSGPGLSPVGGQFPGLQAAYQHIAEEEYRIVRGAADARQAVVENVTMGANVIKIYSNNTPNPALLSLEEMRAIVEEAHRLGVRVRAHATSDRAVWRAAEAGVDGIDHVYQVSDSTLALMKTKGIAMVPTDGDSITMREYFTRAQPGQPLTAAQIGQFLAPQQERLRRAMAAGVTIAAGSDMYLHLQGVPQGVAARRVLRAYAEAGMPPVQVLLAATRNAARLLGQEQRLGVIRKGATADIIAVEGDPGASIGALEEIRFVMKRGTVYVRVGSAGLTRT